MEHLIRSCLEKDLPALLGLCAEHAEFEKADFSSEGKLERWQLAFFGTRPWVYGLVAEASGSLIGYATYTIDFSTWEACCYVHMDCLYVREAYRGRGIGKALLHAVMAVGGAAGYGQVQWQTPGWNKDAARFYEREGASGKEKIRFVHRTTWHTLL